MEEEKHLNYKKVIFVVAIIVLSISCIYIGVILPQIAFKPKEQENIKTSEQQEGRQNSNVIEVILEPKEDIPSREETFVYPQMTPEKVEKVANIYHSDYKRVFLTFDDGPSKTVTPEILRILDEYGVKATFFVLGSRAEIYPELIQDEYNKGHYVANHGYSHKYSSIYASIDNVIDEYTTTENIIRNCLGMEEYKSNVFRFPGGKPGGKYANLKQQAADALKEMNVAYLDWNCLTRDSEGSFDKDTLVRNMIDTAGEKTSIVVLMHDAGNKITTYEALPEVIEYFKNNGYVFENLYNILSGQ
ncbi:MAG: polysaccharide deacetylase [Clostridia bacterium]|nr:polysaccharide deacetylase [Clostridia bacterium]